MNNITDLSVGDRVCVVGRGTANLVHVHATVTRRTRTMLVVGYTFRGRELERRYYLATGREVGSSEYGGTTVHTTCQRP